MKNHLICYGQNVKAVFDSAIKVALRPPKHRKKKKKQGHKGRVCVFL